MALDGSSLNDWLVWMAGSEWLALDGWFWMTLDDPEWLSMTLDGSSLDGSWLMAGSGRLWMTE
jgi:hypothetical protein